MKQSFGFLSLLLIVQGLFGTLNLSAVEAQKSAPLKPPAWLAGKPLNIWFSIKGTEGAGGAAVDAYSGMALKENTSEIFIAAAGGHSDSSDNRVVSIDLRADAPAWVQRHAPSPNPDQNVSHNSDGLPGSRHTYSSTIYVAAVDRVMLVGCRFGWPGAHEFPKFDAFNPAKNAWDPAGTFPDLPKGANYGVVKNTLTGDIWTNGLYKWTAATKTWSNPITKHAPHGVRFPYAFDSKRNQLFGLNFTDGQGYGDKVISAIRVPVDGKESIQVTFKDSDGVKQFIQDAPTYSGMDYDPDNDRFLFYCGQGSGAGRVFVIKPNETNVWEMSLFAFGPGSTSPPESPGSGVNNRIAYVPQLKGFVVLPVRSSDLYFIRTALLPGEAKK